jgi:CobQ-like glutamine amidotransferase family enzyme
MRLAYAGVAAPDEPEVPCEVIDALDSALDRALDFVPTGGSLAAIVTYSAMLDLRQVLARRGHVASYWDDPTASVPVKSGGSSLDSGANWAPLSDFDDGRISGTRTAATGARTHSSVTRVAGRRVRVGHLYADLLNLYADRGNVISLRRRCEWRGIAFEVVPFGVGDRIAPGSVDLAFMGGGQDGDQAFLADDLFRVKAEGLRGLVADGVPLLAVCGSYQLLGHYYDPATGPRLPGLGIFDLHTAHPGVQATRCIGNVVVEWDDAPRHVPRTVVGFENHGGRTWLGPGATPFARVVTGFGNNGKDQTEGIIVGNAIGTYMHGSLLPKNPHLSDRLIALALDPTGATDLEPLDDAVEWRAHRTVLRRFAPMSVARGVMETLKTMTRP